MNIKIEYAPNGRPLCPECYEELDDMPAQGRPEFGMSGQSITYCICKRCKGEFRIIEGEKKTIHSI